MRRPGKVQAYIKSKNHTEKPIIHTLVEAKDNGLYNFSKELDLSEALILLLDLKDIDLQIITRKIGLKPPCIAGNLGLLSKLIIGVKIDRPYKRDVILEKYIEEPP